MIKSLTFIFVLIGVYSVNGQGCCSGGAGSPIAGGASTGVLKKNQMEISGNYQFNQSNKFFASDKDTLALFDNLNSNYLFLRVDYGLSKKLTMSLATGYFINKSMTELSQINPITNELEVGETISSKGIGDLIIFPRYNIYNKTKGIKRTEITLGLGMKIPLGSHTDSNLVFSSPLTGDIYTTSPPTVQSTNGSNDFMFYSFLYHSFGSCKPRVFVNTLYVRKGFNSSGQKFGDYASVGLFVGRTFFSKLGVTLQAKGEWIGEIQAAKHVDLLAQYNIEQLSTGGAKLFFVPQVSFTHRKFTVFATTEIPLYQNLKGVQVGSQFQATTGINYRFMAGKEKPLVIESL